MNKVSPMKRTKQMKRVKTGYSTHKNDKSFGYNVQRVNKNTQRLQAWS